MAVFSQIKQLKCSYTQNVELPLYQTLAKGCHLAEIFSIDIVRLPGITVSLFKVNRSGLRGRPLLTILKSPIRSVSDILYWSVVYDNSVK
jgi:hypothetical protein